MNAYAAMWSKSREDKPEGASSHSRQCCVELGGDDGRDQREQGMALLNFFVPAFAQSSLQTPISFASPCSVTSW